MPAKHPGRDPAACREAVSMRIITADLAAIFAGSRGQRVRLRGQAQAQPAVLPAGSGGAGGLPQAQAGVTWQTASRWERASPESPHIPTSASPPRTMSRIEEIAGLERFPDGFCGFTPKCYVWIDRRVKIPTREEFGCPWGTALKIWDNEGPPICQIVGVKSLTRAASRW